jgi:hypothetical protein
LIGDWLLGIGYWLISLAYIVVNPEFPISNQPIPNIQSPVTNQPIPNTQYPMNSTRHIPFTNAKRYIGDILYCFPLRLMQFQGRNLFVLLSLWVVLYLLMTGKLARSFGVHYLFLSPEYLGVVNFWSFFFVGLAFGSFYMTWNLTSYLLCRYRFPFLASLQRPFTKFCLNNFIVPLVFVGLYLFHIINFLLYEENSSIWTPEGVFFNCMGFIFGLMVLILIVSMYFGLTNKDISNFLLLNQQLPADLKKAIEKRRQADIQLMLHNHTRWRVSTYVSESLRPRIVRSVAHYEPSMLIHIFRQNHLNATFAQLLGMFVLLALSWMMDNQYCRIPAAASIFLLFSVVLSGIAAIMYWFQRWSIPVLLGFLLVMNYITSWEMFDYSNKMYGLNYQIAPAIYSQNSLTELCSQENVCADIQSTTEILDKWKLKNTSQKNKKPKLVIVCTSGGGLKSALWTMQVLRKADSLSNGQFMQRTALMTGASGGMLGMAYYRELYLKELQTKGFNHNDTVFVQKMGDDLLNRLGFAIVANDIFLPWGKFKLGEQSYIKDRAYSFEQQFNENTDNLLSKPIGAYREPEQNALIPMLFVTPAIVNDYRRLIISPQKNAYMMLAPIGVRDYHTVEVDAVDATRLLENHHISEMLMTSALRANASFPYILPEPMLPTQPRVSLIDAGVRDNYGALSAARFVQVFKDWILANTSGVVLVQIMGWDKIGNIQRMNKRGILSQLINPVSIAGQYTTTLQNFERDMNIGMLEEVLGKQKFEVVRFNYIPSEKNKEASLTFHLTGREKQDILLSIYRKENKYNMKKLLELLR